MVDRSVRFIDQDIDAGDPELPTLTPQQLFNPNLSSPFGVWGAIGTAAGQEAIESGW